MPGSISLLVPNITKKSPALLLLSVLMTSALTLCHSYLNPYCLGRKTAFFFSGHLNLHAKPETGIPYREKNYNN
jgi:hypothetical protein